MRKTHSTKGMLSRPSKLKHNSRNEYKVITLSASPKFNFSTKHAKNERNQRLTIAHQHHLPLVRGPGLCPSFLIYRKRVGHSATRLIPIQNCTRPKKSKRSRMLESQFRGLDHDRLLLRIEPPLAAFRKPYKKQSLQSNH